jgi:hypothetical protein
LILLKEVTAVAQIQDSLKEKIIREMTADYSDALEKNFNLAKQFIRITKNGKVDILCKDKLTGQEQILIYLIGKLYAREAGLAPTGDASNKELMDEIGIPKGSLLPWLKELRDRKRIDQIKREKYKHHSISLNFVDRTLHDIDKKLKK